jgi:putative membrane protein
MSPRLTLAAPPTEPRDQLAYDRTHLANERTFAAWVRTGLSVAAGGVAVAHLVPASSRAAQAALLLGAGYVLFGLGLVVYGARQFARIAALLDQASHRRSPIAASTVYGVTAVLGFLLLAVLLLVATQTPAS